MFAKKKARALRATPLDSEWTEGNRKQRHRNKMAASWSSLWISPRWGLTTGTEITSMDKLRHFPVVYQRMGCLSFVDLINSPRFLPSAWRVPRAPLENRAKQSSCWPSCAVTAAAAAPLLCCCWSRRLPQAATPTADLRAQMRQIFMEKIISFRWWITK